MSGGAGYLLDTNVVLHLMRGNALGQSIASAYGLRDSLNRGVISVVTVGEMLALARHRNWEAKKSSSLKALLDQLVWIDINAPDILEAYSVLDSESLKQGKRMGKNDVWIAATARVSGLTLLTTDLDFDHLHGTWIDRIWIDPKTD